MKVITTVTETEIEASAEELRQSTMLSEAFAGLLRRALIPQPRSKNIDVDVEESEDEESEGEA